MLTLDEARAHLKAARRVAVLTGAGISAPSGIPTFREAQTGLWARFKPEDLASPKAYWRDPETVWDWYAGRYRDVMAAQPNPGHRLLTQLEQEKAGAELAGGLTLVTQNVDGLHQRAGSSGVLEVHGNLTDARCERCGHLQPLPPPAEFTPPPACEVCGGRGRPHVVWFGEMLPEDVLEAAGEAFRQAEVALVIGTSAQVYPAAGLPELTRHSGGVVIEINPDETDLSARADLSLRMGAEAGLRALMK